MKLLILTFSFICSFQSYGQDSSSIIKEYKDSAVYRLVIRTEVFVNDQYVAMDNFTARVTEDTVRIYYMRYGDGMVSSLMIPFPVYDKFIEFEQKIIEGGTLVTDNEYSIKFEIGEMELRVPVDILFIDNLTHFMFSLED